jgi:hypothetical protein
MQIIAAFSTELLNIALICTEEEALDIVINGAVFAIIS